jgi:YgiT-type zinc finger domain-containing protein
MMPTTRRRCPQCAGDMEPGTTTYCTTIDEGVVVIENVPALICDQCGYEGFALDVSVEMQRLVQERPAPSRTIAALVYELTEGRYAVPPSNGSVNEKRKVV